MASNAHHHPGQVTHHHHHTHPHAQAAAHHHHHAAIAASHAHTHGITTTVGATATAVAAPTAARPQPKKDTAKRPGARRRGRPTKAMVAQRERQQARAAADRVLGALDVIEGSMGGMRAFVDCVSAAVITGTSKKGVRVEQGDVDLAKQAVSSINVAILRLRAAVAAGALASVGVMASNPGASVVVPAPNESKVGALDEDPEEAEKARKLSELTRNMLPNDWRCASCKYVNSFSDGPCGWCGKSKSVTNTGLWDPFKGKRKRSTLTGVMAVGEMAGVGADQSSKGAAKVARKQKQPTLGASVLNMGTAPAIVQPAHATIVAQQAATMAQAAAAAHVVAQISQPGQPKKKKKGDQLDLAANA